MLRGGSVCSIFNFKELQHIPDVAALFIYTLTLFFN